SFQLKLYRPAGLLNENMTTTATGSSMKTSASAAATCTRCEVTNRQMRVPVLTPTPLPASAARPSQRSHPLHAAHVERHRDDDRDHQHHREGSRRRVLEHP